MSVLRPVQFRDGRVVDPRGTRLLIAILSCEKNDWRANGVRWTWQKLLPPSCRLLFVYGRPGQPPGIEGDHLYLDCPESYEKLPQKVHHLLDYCRRNLDFDYLFKTDDDTYLDLERFFSFDLQGADYVGQFREQPLLDQRGKQWHFGKCTDKSYEVEYERPFQCPWATGGGYFLSRRAVELAADRTASTYAENLFEDVMVGEALTRDPDLRVMRSRLATMGTINPLLPKDMEYLQALLLEKWGLVEEVLRLRAEVRPKLEAVPHQ